MKGCHYVEAFEEKVGSDKTVYFYCKSAIALHYSIFSRKIHHSALNHLDKFNLSILRLLILLIIDNKKRLFELY